MKLAATFAALMLAAAPVAAASFDMIKPNGSSRTVDVIADFLPGELFVDDVAFSELSIFVALEEDGSFDPAAQIGEELLFFLPAGEIVGDIWDVRYGPDSIDLLFKVTSDTLPGMPGGDAVLASIDFGGLVDWSGGVMLSDLLGTSGVATLTGNTVVPLPATLPMLLGAIAAGAAIRRVRAA